LIVGVYFNRIEVLICIFLMASDAEHFFMHFLEILTSSFQKVLFSSFAYFFIGSLTFGEFRFLCCLCILVSNH
jgi:hypothetical protein